MSLQFSPSSDVRHDIADGVLRVTIDRAEKRNPLSLGALDYLRRIFTEAATHSDIKVAVITGAGTKAFSSGGDLSELMAVRNLEDAEALSRHGKAALDAIRWFPVPVIARLNGSALGGGAELALACDLRYADSSATLGFVHGRLRIPPAWGGGKDLLRAVGPARALHLMATAAILTAKDGHALGLIELVCPKDVAFDAWFDQQIGTFQDLPRQLLQAQKSIANASRMPNPADEHREIKQFCELWCHEDHWNAVADFEGRRS